MLNMTPFERASRRYPFPALLFVGMMFAALGMGCRDKAAPSTASNTPFLNAAAKSAAATPPPGVPLREEERQKAIDRLTIKKDR